jgi:hypothetical protein
MSVAGCRGRTSQVGRGLPGVAVAGPGGQAGSETARSSSPFSSKGVARGCWGTSCWGVEISSSYYTACGCPVAGSFEHVLCRSGERTGPKANSGPGENQRLLLSMERAASTFFFRNFRFFPICHPCRSGTRAFLGVLDDLVALCRECGLHRRPLVCHTVPSRRSRAESPEKPLHPAIEQSSDADARR